MNHGLLSTPEPQHDELSRRVTARNSRRGLCQDALPGAVTCTVPTLAASSPSSLRSRWAERGRGKSGTWSYCKRARAIYPHARSSCRPERPGHPTRRPLWLKFRARDFPQPRGAASCIRGFRHCRMRPGRGKTPIERGRIARAGVSPSNHTRQPSPLRGRWYREGSGDRAAGRTRESAWSG